MRGAHCEFLLRANLEGEKELGAKREKINRRQNPAPPASKLPSAARAPGLGRGHGLGPRAAEPAQAGVRDQDEGQGWPPAGEAPGVGAWLRPALLTLPVAAGAGELAGESRCGLVTFCGAAPCDVTETSGVVLGLGGRRLARRRTTRR